MSDNIAIVGAHLFNKGDQAMVFTTVDQLKRRNKEAEITLMSELDYNRREEDKEQFAFDILPWNGSLAVRSLGATTPLYDADFYNSDEVVEKIKKADCIIDLSGYGLGSDWGLRGSLGYILNIMVAKKYHIPYYVMPQSIGPFCYSLKEWLVLYPLLKRYLKYPEKVWVRELDGVELVRRFRKDVAWSPDIVLQNDGYSLINCFSQKIDWNEIPIEQDSVGIIPNQKVRERLPEHVFKGMYKALIEKLLENGKTVYILRHSYEDLELCKEIKSVFADEDSVKLITEDLNAIELEYIIQQFDLVIASRYHSLIHAYKHCIPALMIGWAEKYAELTKLFGQEEYFYDLRYELPSPVLLFMLDKLIDDQFKESVTIRDFGLDCQKLHEKVFDEVMV